MVTTGATGENEASKVNEMEPHGELPKNQCAEDEARSCHSEEENVSDDEKSGHSISDLLNFMNPETGDFHTNRNRTNSSCNSNSASLGEAVRCHEVLLPSSADSDKENHPRNTGEPNQIHFEPSSLTQLSEQAADEYENTDMIPLPELLRIHPKQLVSGFEFGEVTKRRAQKNMKSARDKTLEENRKSSEITAVLDEDDKPCCSKTLSEQDHKTPHSYKRQRLGENRVRMPSSDIDFCKTTRGVPACILDHPDCVEVWVFMIYKEEAALKLRNPRLFNDFKGVTPRMRAILLDWLMEVSAVYHLRRVTYYLAVDYFDRFLSIRPDIPKSLLQLVGITCLYIAAKVEEIYPPNLSEFSYVCDGACKSTDVVACELLILNSLGWEVVLTTPSDWLNLYMQMHYRNQEIVRTALNLDFNKDFIFPQYSAYQFTRASQLMDLLTLDPGFLKFSYSTVAATAMYFLYSEETALEVSGLTWEQMKPCADYMSVFYTILQDAPDPRLQSCLGEPHIDDANRVSTGLLSRLRDGPTNENYSFQTHVASMEYFEKATLIRLSQLTRAAPAPPCATKNNNLEDVANPHDLPSVEDSADLLLSLTDDNGKGAAENDAAESLMSLDEIFELILSQEGAKPEEVQA